MLFTRISEANHGNLTKQHAHNGRTYYLNEPFSLAYMVQVVCSPPNHCKSIGVHYPIPESVLERAGDGIYMDTAQRHYLQSRHAFDLPEKNISDALLQVYFQHFHPAFPIFDRKTFGELYLSGLTSTLALQSIFFIASTLCEEALLREAGFRDRRDATLTFYIRAKALYDSDFERDKVTVTAALFLLGFVWQSPEDQKDSWQWLGQAISTAQTLGMHRSTARSSLRSHHRSLWKRIWWSIYVRDRLTAAALGRPVRIRDEDCDIEPLEWADFEEPETGAADICGMIHPCHIHYAIEMSKLAVLFGQVLVTKFAPSRNSSLQEMDAITARLSAWYRQLPRDLDKDSVPGTVSFFWSRMIHAAYDLCQLLVYRPQRIDPMSTRDIKNWTKAVAAANSVSRIAEDLLTTGVLRFGQLHLVPSLFAALSVHCIDVCGKEGEQCCLAEQQSRHCMLALSELSHSWPVAGWILRLFTSLMKRLTGGNFSLDDGLEMMSTRTDLHESVCDYVEASTTALHGGGNLHVDFKQRSDALIDAGYESTDAFGAWALDHDMFQHDHLFRDIFMPSPPSSYGDAFPVAH